MKLPYFTAVCLAASVAFGQQRPRQSAAITIDARHVENSISPRMYASFVEMMAEDVKWGMTAEMVHDRSFEEAPNYLGLPADWNLEPDERNDNVGAIRFLQTTDEAYPKVNAATGAPEHSLRITLTPGDITDTRRGLSQRHLSLRAGQQYMCSFWAKTAKTGGYTGMITVALEEDNTDGESYASASLASVAGDWHRYSVALTPGQTDRFAKLTLLFPGTGALYLDQISLEPTSAVSEVRADAEAMIRDLHPSFLRWPGGNVAQDYHWQWGVGPRDLRPVWINRSWSNAPEPGDLGTDEYLALCARLHVEPSITVNVDGAGATPEEAAEWVEYVNGAAETRFGKLRAANGHPAPYGVKQWELGNEIFGDWVRGHVTAEQYAQAAVRYAKAMRAVDPSIRLIAVGEGLGSNSDAWNIRVLKVAGPEIQYLAVHDYTSLSQNAGAANPRAAMMARAGEFEANYRHMADLIRENAKGFGIRLIVNEWNLFYSADVAQSMEGAVYASRMMNGFEREGDIVAANCISDLLNGWIGGVIQASRDRVYGTPEYYALKMYGDHLGTERVSARVVSPDLQPGTPSVDGIATQTADRSHLFVKFSNADAENSLSITISLEGFPHKSFADLTLLASSKALSRNTFSKPASIHPVTRTLRCEQVCVVQIPADSVGVLTFDAGR